MSTKDILIDLNINKQFVQFLEYFKSNIVRMLEEIDSNFIDFLEDDYKNDFGHSHSFYQVLSMIKNEFEEFTSIDDYLDFQISSFAPYSIWKPIFNRNINYTNEQGLLDSIVTQISTPLLALKQLIFYFGSIWVDSPVSTFFDSNASFTIVIDSNTIPHDVYYLGVVNFMSLRKKKYIYNAFCEVKATFDRIFSAFQDFYNSTTKKNENLDSIRNMILTTLQSLENICILLQNAKDELNHLTVDTASSSILESPELSIFFRNYITSICSELTTLNQNFNDLIAIM